METGSRITRMGRASPNVLDPEDFMATNSEVRLNPENVMTTASSTHMGSTISRIVGVDRTVESRNLTKLDQLENMDSRFPNMFAMSSSITMDVRHRSRYLK